MQRTQDVDGAPIPVRTNRFFAAQGAWYFSTREGSSIGPFEDKGEAQKGLDDFIEFMTLAEPKTLTKFHNSLTN
ncbi:MAG: hypothetical protein ACJA0N_000796 [Pseudohongiellaceae bacterium]|jgi:hypothetical protein